MISAGLLPNVSGCVDKIGGGFCGGTGK